jgi:hypothetical protein
MNERHHTVDEMLVAARARLERLSPEQANEAVRAGALLVDIRADSQRAADGQVPDATFARSSPGTSSSGASTRPRTIAIPSSRAATAASC